ncbi:hypothetical protein B0H13DRAFT_1893956 [Mycena leptocephala]|nr:hypothetical protein B0H13DRAFT_1893956 [Mycena leptocephala]
MPDASLHGAVNEWNTSFDSREFPRVPESLMSRTIVRDSQDRAGGPERARSEPWQRDSEPEGSTSNDSDGGAGKQRLGQDRESRCRVRGQVESGGPDDLLRPIYMRGACLCSKNESIGWNVLHCGKEYEIERYREKRRARMREYRPHSEPDDEADSPPLREGPVMGTYWWACTSYGRRRGV